MHLADPASRSSDGRQGSTNSCVTHGGLGRTTSSILKDSIPQYVVTEPSTLGFTVLLALSQADLVIASLGAVACACEQDLPAAGVSQELWTALLPVALSYL